MKRVPVIQQLSAVECGPSCLAMVLSAHGRATQVRQLRDSFGTGRDGTNGRVIVEVARREGMVAKGVRVDPAALDTVALPAIAHWDNNHFVVVERVGHRRIGVVDPASGRRRLDRAEFAEHFSGVLVELTPGPDFQPRRTRPGQGRAGRFLRDLVRMAPGWFVLALVLAGITQLVGLAAAWANQYAIDSVIGTGAGTLGVLAAGVAGYVLVSAVTGLGRGLALLVLQQRLDHQLTSRFMTHLLRLPYPFFQTRSAGDLLTRLTSNTIVRELLTSQMVTLVVDSLFVIVYTAVLATISPPFAAVVAIIGVVQALLVLATLRPMHELAQRELATQSESQSVAVESIYGVEFLKSAGLTTAALDRWGGLLREYLRAAFRRRRFDTLNESALGMLQLAAPLVLLLVGTWQVLGGHLSVGGMVALTAVAGALLRPLGQLIGSLRYLQTLGSHLERIYDVLETPVERPAPGAIRPERVAGDVELDAVSFGYAAGGSTVLNDISLRVPAGSKVAVVGATGSGKTTLVRLLTGLLVPTAGQVRVDGRPLGEYDTEHLRRQFGLVTQEPHVFGGSIRHNLTLGAGDLPDETILAALDRACFLDDLRRMPMGLETVVADGGSALSGGQRQRLAIARALLANPAVLILDEATSHLDAITEATIAEHLSDLGCTRIVIAHRISTVIDADEIVVLHEGTVIEQGRHDELVALGGRYAQLVSRQLPKQVLEQHP